MWLRWRLVCSRSLTTGKCGRCGRRRPALPGVPRGVSVLRSGFGTVGWVVRRSAVPAVLALLADTLPYDYVDICVFGFAAQPGALRVYVSTAEPRVFHAGFPTTIVR